MSSVFNQSSSNGELEQIGIAGFTAFVFTDRSVSQSTNIPSNVLEDGCFVNDHIVINPTKLSISGIVSDTYIKLDPNKSLIKLPRTISADNHFSKLYDLSKTHYQSVKESASSLKNKLNTDNNSVDIANNFGNKSSRVSRQFVEAMNTITLTKQLISIETKFKSYQNMAITSFSVKESNENDAITFSLSAQEIRIVEEIYGKVKLKEKMKNPASPNQVSENVDKGQQNGQEVSRDNPLFWAWTYAFFPVAILPKLIKSGES